MAGELQVDAVTGKTVYFLLRTATGTIWNGSGFETFTPANYANYPISASEQGTTGYFLGNVPAVARGYYNVVAKIQGGGSAAQGDASAGNGWIYWDGAAIQIFPANFAVQGIDSNGRVEIQSGITKNAAYSFSFLMVLSSDHISPAIGKTVAAQKSLNNGAFSSTSNVPTEISNGIYTISATAAEMNAGVVTFRFSASGCDDRFVELQTTA